MYENIYEVVTTLEASYSFKACCELQRELQSFVIARVRL